MIEYPTKKIERFILQVIDHAMIKIWKMQNMSNSLMQIVEFLSAEFLNFHSKRWRFKMILIHSLWVWRKNYE